MLPGIDVFIYFIRFISSNNNNDDDDDCHHYHYCYDTLVMMCRAWGSRLAKEWLSHLVQLGVEWVGVLLQRVVVGPVEGTQEGPAPLRAVVAATGVQQVAVEEEHVACSSKYGRTLT